MRPTDTRSSASATRSMRSISCSRLLSSLLSATRPPCPVMRNRISVGMLRMPKRADACCACSVFTLAKATCPRQLLAADWNSGAMALHGPHQLAQKSTNTGRSLLPVYPGISASLNSATAPSARAPLQAPHFGPSLSRCAGTRFIFLQCGQPTCSRSLMVKVSCGSTFVVGAGYAKSSREMILVENRLTEADRRFTYSDDTL